MNAPSRHWAVVGGGMLGMTLAHRLKQSGQRVTLLEASEGLGGLASAWELDQIVWDRFYHVILLSDMRLRQLLTELGLESEMQWVETKTGFFTDGRFHSMSNSLEFLRFPPIGLIDKFRLALTILYASRIKNWKSLEQVQVGDWLRRWSGKNTFEKIWLPLLRSKLGDAHERTSAAFIWATISRMYAARRSGLKKEMFGYVPGGYASILDRFEEKLRADGVTIETGRPVERVCRGTGGGIEVHSPDREPLAADEAVLTMPAPLACRISEGLSSEEIRRQEQIEYLGIVCASVLLRRPFAGYYVTNITDSWVPFTAVIEMSSLVDPGQLGGNHLLYLPKYLTAGDPLFEATDAELEERFLPALFRMDPTLIPEDVLAFRVSRARNVFALSTLGYSEQLPPMSTSVPGLHIVNSSHIVNGTLNVNETVQLAERAVGQLLSSESSTEEPA